MLKHRQDGLVFLHGLFLDVAIIALFLIQVAVFKATGLIQFDLDASGTSYLMAVVVAMLWNHHALAGFAVRLGNLTLRETLRLTRQQLSRMMAALFAVGFAIQRREDARLFIGCFAGVAGVLLFAANWWAPRRLARFLFRSLNHRTLVLASAADAARLQEWLAERQYLGQEIVGCVLPSNEHDVPKNATQSLGSPAQLRTILADHRVNQVVLDRRKFSAEEVRLIQDEAEHAGCRVRYFLDLHDSLGGEMAQTECHDRYVFAAQAPEPLDNPVNQLLKRTLDLAVAIPVVVFVLPPLTLLVWIAQRLQSPGPVFYPQERSGLNRQRFHIFKYRTMHHGLEQQRARQATRGDARIYPFGAFLRKTSLDEFPQFINVLLGEMSVSGPRPHLLEHDQQFAAIVDSYYQRHFVKPGITGLAQSEGLRGEVFGRPELLRQRIERDLRYVKMWSLQLDLKIIASTARQVVRPPRAAY